MKMYVDMRAGMRMAMHLDMGICIAKHFGGGFFRHTFLPFCLFLAPLQQKQKLGWPLDPVGLRLYVVEAAGRERSQPIRRRQAR